MLTKAPKGTKDIYGDEVYIWQSIEAKIRGICESYGVSEIRTPMFEHTELFVRSSGEASDIVQKEMYTFSDRANRSLTLRPEGTACVARAYIENSLYAQPQPTKLYYLNPTFRCEKPQDGRQRQFHQFGIEVFGSASAYTDAEVISLAKELIDELGIPNTELRINSLGTVESRAVYVEELKKFINQRYDSLCKTCKDRLETNPLRVLDCKDENCQRAIKDAPLCLDYLDEESGRHFEELKKTLTEMEVPFVIDPLIVRGLDYYTRTVFEIVSYDIGAQKTVCGGGRYDTMIEELGGPATPAFGFGLGMERLIIALKAVGQAKTDPPKPEYYVGAIGEKGVAAANKLVYKLRKRKISAEGDLMGRSVKAQLKYADKIGAKNTIIIGDDEILNDKISVKNMETGEKSECVLSTFLD